MIEETLSFLRDQINDYLIFNVEPPEDRVVIENVVTQDGTLSNSELCLSLIRVEEEKIHKEQSPYKTMNDGSINLVNPKIKLNLYLLLSSNFPDYGEALRFLSHTISFFQGKQVFNPQNSPTLDERIEKLIVELVTLSFEQQNHLWGFIGAKYIPSVLYKVRLLSVASENVLQGVETLEELNTNLAQS